MNNTMILYAHLTDKELLASVDHPGKKNCFEVLVRRHSTALYRTARMYGFSHSDAEELVQCTYIEAYRHRTQSSPNHSYRTWLTGLMIKNCLQVRKEKGTQINDEKGTQINDDSTAEPSCKAVRSAHHLASERLSAVQVTTAKLEEPLEQLSLPLRSVYILMEIDGYSLAETSYLLSTTEENVKLRLQRAKANIRKSHRTLYRLSDIYPLDAHRIDRIVNEVMRKIDSKIDLPLGVPTY